MVQPAEHGKELAAFEQNWKCNDSIKVYQGHFLFFQVFSLNLDSTDLPFVPGPHAA